jgi:hypothetical protein
MIAERLTATRPLLNLAVANDRAGLEHALSEGNALNGTGTATIGNRSRPNWRFCVIRH